MWDRYYKVRRLLQRATEQCSGSKDGKPAFHPYRYHLGLVKPQRLASLLKQKFALCKVRGRLATSRPLISSYRKWAKWVSMHEVAQRPSEWRSLELDLFRLNESECWYNYKFTREKNAWHMLCRERRVISLTVLLVNYHDVTDRIFDRWISRLLLPHEKFLQSDWLRAVVFQLNLKYLHVKITNLLRVVV